MTGLWWLLFATGWLTASAVRRASRLVDARTLTQLLDEDKT
jgi:hypothetical protein